MGLKDMGSNGSSYVKFDEGDNALVKLKKLKPETEPSEYQGNKYFEVELVFDAVNEQDSEDRGTVPMWPTSKITVADSDEHTSDMAKLLQKSGVLRDVLKQVIGDSDAVGKVMAGEKRWEADTADENQELGKAIANHLEGKILRVGTKPNASEDYSIVDSVYALVDKDPFEDSESSESEKEEDDSEDAGDSEDEEESEDDGDEMDVVFDEDEEEEDEPESEGGESGDEEEEDEEE